MMEFHEIYNQLERYVHWLAEKTSKQNSDADLMNYDDMVGELFLELWKGYTRYKDKPADELLAILRRMMDNRISELRYRYLVTHRKQEITNVTIIHDPHETSEWDEDLDVISDEIIEDIGSDPAVIYMSLERVFEVRDALNETERRIFDAVLFGDEMVDAYVAISIRRANYVYKSGGTVKVRPFHISDALQIPEKDVVAAFRKVKKVYAGVVDGS